MKYWVFPYDYIMEMLISSSENAKIMAKKFLGKELVPIACMQTPLGVPRW